ncbi:nucleic acid binding [Mactra antiquata]
METGNQAFVSRLIKQSILTLCKEAVEFKHRLEVDGIVCLMVDNTEQLVVKVHEIIDKDRVSDNNQAASSPSISNGSAIDSVTKSSSRGPTLSTNEDINVKDEHIEIKMETEPEIELRPSTPANEGQAVSEELNRVRSDSLDNNSNSSRQNSVQEKLTISTATNILCKKCNKVLDNVGLFEAHNMTSHGHFTCLICLSTFTSRNNMKRHIRLHTGIKPYSCHKCSESFSRNDDFKRHLLKHTFQKPFRCSICKIGYSDRSSIKTHVLKDHNTKVFHICPQCGETFLDMQAMQKHKKIHPECQDYRCTVCSFTGLTALMYHKHMLTHGPRKRYTCNHCEITFPDPFTYTSHLKKHKGDELVQSYVCCFCETSLPTFELFQKHENTHIHSKQHVCTQCTKIFRYPSNLREHMLTHMPRIDLLAGISPNRRVASDENDKSHMNASASTSTLHMNYIPDDAVDNNIEENNNHVTTDKIQNEADIDGNDASDDTTGSSEYWCTECNHGFGSESKLQSHIEEKHEMNHDVDRYSDESMQAFSADIETIDYRPKLGDRNSTLMKNYGYNTNTLDDSVLGYQNFGHISKMKRRQHQVYDEETVVDQDEHVDDDAVLAPYKDNMSDAEMEIVKDAMKQVHKMQSKFGIKPSKNFNAESHDGSNGSEGDVDARFELFNGESNNKTSPSPPLNNHPSNTMSVTMSGMKMKIHRSLSSSGAESNSDHRNDTENSTWKKPDDEIFARPENLIVGKQNASTFEMYSKSSVLGMDTEFSEYPNRSATTTINLKVRNPGFERVVTPEVLFKTKAPFNCEVCQETFENFELFHDHGVKVHRKFICSYCGKVFTSRPNRERHIRYHTGEKPYKCDLCPASFLRGDDLKYHRTTKHADVKPFTCGACQTSFALPKDLEKHLKIYPDHKL